MTRIGLAKQQCQGWSRGVWAMVLLAVVAGLFGGVGGAAQTVGQTPAVRNMVAAGYQSDFGRAATAAEMAYWSSVAATDARVSTRNGFLLNNRAWMRSNAAERQAAITRAYQATFGRGPAADELKYWDGRVAGTGEVYSELVAANQAWLRQNPQARPQAPVQAQQQPQLPAAPRTERGGMVQQAYMSAFGRQATAAEVNYWNSLSASDSRVENVTALVNANRQWLKKNAGERTATITRSYNTVFQRAPQAGELVYWSGQVQSSGLDYDELVAAHRKWLAQNPQAAPVQQAPVQQLPAAPRTERGGMVQQAYMSAFGRQATAAEVNFWNSLPASDSRVENVTALVNANRQWLKRNAGERTATITRSYNTVFQRAPQPAELVYWVGQIESKGLDYDDLVATHRQYIARNPGSMLSQDSRYPGSCFGAVGANCTGMPGVHDTGQESTIGLGLKMAIGCSAVSAEGYRACFVVPGSIRHDNCCLAHPNGKMCGGPMEEPNVCAAEWDDAQRGVANVRGWIAYFDVKKPDEKFPTQPSTRYAPGEAPATAALCAPAGANIDMSDGAQFCCSKRFSQKWWVPQVGLVGGQWGVCAAPGSRSVMDVASGPQQWQGQIPIKPEFQAPLQPPTAAQVQGGRSGR